MQTTYIFGLVFGAIVLVSIFMRMRNQGMKERYATWWIVIALSVITFSVYLRRSMRSLTSSVSRCR